MQGKNVGQDVSWNKEEITKIPRHNIHQITWSALSDHTMESNKLAKKTVSTRWYNKEQNHWRIIRWVSDTW
jgi:hypothetical protein